MSITSRDGKFCLKQFPDIAILHAAYIVHACTWLRGAMAATGTPRGRAEGVDTRGETHLCIQSAAGLSQATICLW